MIRGFGFACQTIHHGVFCSFLCDEAFIHPFFSPRSKLAHSLNIKLKDQVMQQNPVWCLQAHGNAANNSMAAQSYIHPI